MSFRCRVFFLFSSFARLLALRRHHAKWEEGKGKKKSHNLLCHFLSKRFKVNCVYTNTRSPVYEKNVFISTLFSEKGRGGGQVKRRFVLSCGDKTQSHMWCLEAFFFSFKQKGLEKWSTRSCSPLQCGFLNVAGWLKAISIIHSTSSIHNESLRLYRWYNIYFSTSANDTRVN